MKGALNLRGDLAHTSKDDDVLNNTVNEMSEAVKAGHIGIVRDLWDKLLSEGVNILHAEYTGGERTALMMAAEAGQLEVVRYLLEKGAVVNDENIFGCSVMNFAADKGHLEIIHELLNWGADINADYGLSLIHI